MKHLIKIESVAHGVVSVKHKGLDSQYCEAGKIVKIKYQPQVGWGLQEAHYTPEGGDPVAIEDGEFTMPSTNITIGATFKKFVISDWTSGKDADENAGKVLGFDEGGNLVPVDGGGGGEKPIVVHFPQSGIPYFDFEEKDLPIFPAYPQDTGVGTLYELQQGQFVAVLETIGQDGDDPLHYTGETTSTTPKNTGYSYLYFITGFNPNVGRIFPAKIVYE